MATAIEGYDDGFLPVEVPLPRPGNSIETIDLPYVHFTVVFEPARRLAVATGVNIDGADLKEIERADKWHFDPRLSAADQAGEDIYAHNDLDRGHLVRRRDPVWGTDDIAAAANESTFVFTNAAPQAAPFNQGENLWAGVEDHVLEYGRVNKLRLSVFTGPVFGADDPIYRGLPIPLQFWKIAAWTTTNDGGASELSAVAFILDQKPELDEIGVRTARALAAGDPPPLGPFLTFQVPVSDVAKLTRLELGGLEAADRFPAVVPRGGDGQRSSWRRLTRLMDVILWSRPFRDPTA